VLRNAYFAWAGHDKTHQGGPTFLRRPLRGDPGKNPEKVLLEALNEHVKKVGNASLFAGQMIFFRVALDST